MSRLIKTQAPSKSEFGSNVRRLTCGRKSGEDEWTRTTDPLHVKQIL